MHGMPITPSYLRQHLYTILDTVAETGVSPEIKLRKGRSLRIVAERASDPFKRLKKHPRVLRGKPDSIVHLDWSKHWHNALP